MYCNYLKNGKALRVLKQKELCIRTQVNILFYFTVSEEVCTHIKTHALNNTLLVSKVPLDSNIVLLLQINMDTHLDLAKCSIQLFGFQLIWKMGRIILINSCLDIEECILQPVTMICL